jgi:phytoene synthase
MTVQNPDAKALTRKSGTSFYYSFALLTPEKRRALYALYNLCRHLDDLADHASSPESGKEALSRWRTEIAEAFDGRPTHPLIRELFPYLKTFGIPQKYLLELISGIEMDLPFRGYDTFDELRQYCYRVASVVGLMSIEIFGYRNPATRFYAENLGLALQLTNILRDLKSDALRGRIYLPREELKRFGYSEEDLRGRLRNAAFNDLMRFQCGRARDYYRKAETALPPEDRPAMIAARVMAATYRRLLDKIERTGYNVYEADISLSKPEKIWVAVKTWLAG